MLFCFSTFSQVTPCAATSNFHLVVLGSSTAAGSGPSSSDSAWVNRYRKYIQAINPLNQITNLAIGGTNTYKIMPDWFIPPTGRPITNTSNNVSEAVRLNADAIIVNMPSNDAASGFGVNEQMSNFITIKQVADSFNIPIWICTTQPRNFSSTQKLIQTLTRDSILNYFGSKAIDFWTGFADTSNSIKPIFDSGDGIHMNDTAHNILNQIVIGLNIPNLLADTLPYTDYILSKTQFDNPSICGKTDQVFEVIYSNRGIFNPDSFQIKYTATELINNIQIDSIITKPNGLNPCATDTIQFQFNNKFKSNFNLKAYLISNDSIKQNDTSKTTTIISIGQPTLNNTTDTVCINNSAVFYAPNHNNIDTIIWYDSQNSNQILHIGDSLNIGPITKDSTLFAESVRGPLHYTESLFTTSSSNVNWNGMMFNLIAKDSIHIDSIRVKLFDIGFQKIHAYYIKGNYKGSENIPNKWTYWGVDSLQVNTQGDFGDLNYADLKINANDTLGIYIHLDNSSARLSYQRSTSTYYLGNSKLEIESGTGVNYTFGTTYNPRNFSGEIFYHYGFNPKGFCTSDRKTISIHPQDPQFSLGNDTAIALGSNLFLTAPNNSTYLWSNGSTLSQILIDSSNFYIGLNSISLDIIDSQGCLYKDTILVTIGLTTEIKDNTISNFSFSPNPSNGKIQLFGNLSEIDRIEILNLKGQTIKQFNELRTILDIENLAKGIYILRIFNNNNAQNYKLILE